MNPLAIQVAQTFREQSGLEPALYFSPGRINLIGEHVDYNDGFVMPAAIDKGIYYAIALNGSDTIRFYSIDFDEFFSVEISAVGKAGAWKDYVLGVVKEFELLGVELKGFDCVFAGDIPRGSGLSSSAAVEGGLAFALNDLLGVGLDRLQLALLCQRAEHHYPGVQCGIMDQFANMMGQKDRVILLDCQGMHHVYFPLQLEGYSIVLLNSKVHHSLMAGEYNLRRSQCAEGLAVMSQTGDVNSFRDLVPWQQVFDYKNQMGEKAFMRCLYVVQEIDRAERASQLLQQQDIRAFGELMFETHRGLSELYEVSCRELDFLVSLARAKKEVIGARLMGGGFGGCTINIVKNEMVETFIHDSTIAYEDAFGIAPEAYRVQTDDGTRKL
ncbi:galactokinase [Ferruginibacter sp. HRS2-29]|uniref:galactokinase n=1 Tax=Ferruginibacter sp. HRS2-29 TaxID=2487334 RepID=UPI0020CC32BE|nr:galactokinase [Ferruginibacter sp. HRS2-29]MCP9749895.1 galactokinase [Ferruginibacter sp. HRS2-29]